MFGIGGVELVIILLFAFLIVGPDKLPDVAKTLGQGVAKFRSAQDQMNTVIKEQSEAIKSEVNASRQEKKAAAPAPKPEPAAPAETAPATEEPATQPAADPAKPLSFSERKAQYEKERAAQREAEAAAAKEGE